MSKGICVMLVDDNETDNFISKSIINLTGLAYQIVDFTSAMKAKDYLLSNSANSANLPDLIILDINMPIVSGIVFLYELEKIERLLCKNPAVVILSSFEQNEDTDLIVNSDRVIRYLTKPLSPELFEEIAKELTKINLKVA